MDTFAIIRRLLHVALPILLSSLVGLFAPLVSVAIVGRDSAASLYILGLYLPLSFLQTYINESLRVSAVAFSSRAAGSGNMAALARQLRGLLALAAAIYLVLATGFWLVGKQLMALDGVPSEQQSVAYAFMQLSIGVGIPAVVSMCMMSMLYGIGQTYRVTVATVVGIAASILLTLIFVIWCNLGLFALPLASLITSSATIAWATFALAQGGVVSFPGSVTRGGAENAVDGVSDGRFWTCWPQIYRISMPVFVGYLALVAYSLLFTYLLSLFSPDDIAGFGVAYRIQNLVLMPGIALGVALAINVNRVVAAHEEDQVYRFLSTALTVSFSVFVGLAAVVFAGRELLPALITTDPSVVAAASHYLAYLGPALVALGPLLTLLIYFEETGNGLRSLIFNATTLGAQLVLAFAVAEAYHSLDLVYRVVALSDLATLLFIVYELDRAKRLRGYQVGVLDAI
jgi:Na+-driven multidrug efflux pump